MKMTTCFFLLALSVFGLCHAESPLHPKIVPAYDVSAFDNAITDYYRKNLHNHSNNSRDDRVEAASRWLLGKPYELGALGEGASGQFDQHPLYRLDSFDCVTYVSTVLALAHAENLTQFKRKMLQINYHDGIADYVHRNHFMSVDWNPTVWQQGMARDITHKILDENGVPAAEIADTNINKPEWYRFKQIDSIALQTELSSDKKVTLLKQLHDLSKEVQQEKAVMLYIPLNKLFIDNRKPNAALFAQIPNASIIEIVRPNWDVAAKIGTRMHVSHLGIALRTKQGLIFREASSIDGKVIEIPLTTYLKPYLNSPSIKGIHIQKII